jgi:hypothetical protein
MSQQERVVSLPLANFGHAVRLHLAISIVFVMIALTACAKPQILIDRLMVRNATPGAISDVKVVHEPTLRFGAVSMILPDKSYEILFQRQPMLARQAVLGWRDEAGHPWSVAVVLPRESSVAAEGRAVSLVYEIHPAGEVTVSLQPSP